MSSFCKVIMVGNLTRDPELRYTPSGTPLAQFGVAVNRRWKDEQGQEKEEVTFVDCDAWKGTAEMACKWFRKGAPIMVEGRLKLDQWDDRNTGQKHSKLKVVVERIHFLPRNERQSASGQAHEASSQYDQTRNQTRGAEAPQQDAQYGGSQIPPGEEDVPF